MLTFRKLCALALASAFVLLDVDLSAPLSFTIGTPAEARIGHPLTPLSYAGVARRTARRTVRRTVRRLTVLPAGCVYGPYYGAYYYNCGGLYYARSGGVYIQVIIE
ncbi:MAG: hypothetical protein EOS27_12060 [Mesorhizobium sp.]|nr:MAG: hypothetical protein EOS27_12060 [Mesorhizobium sp.]